MRSPFTTWSVSLLALGALPARVLGGDILSTDGYTICMNDPTVTVNTMNVKYDRSTNLVTFDVSGSSSESQNVTAQIVVTAYGEQVYKNTFDPCSKATLVTELCPGTSPGEVKLHDETLLT